MHRILLKALELILIEEDLNLEHTLSSQTRDGGVVFHLVIYLTN